MVFTFLLLGILLVGLILVAIGAGLLLLKKSKLAGFIFLGVGMLTMLLSFFGFLSLVITSRTMG